MPFVILLLLAILIVLIGGPLALGFAIALPVWLIWASGIIQFLFWVIVGAATLVIVVTLAPVLMRRLRTPSVPKNTIVAGPSARYKCVKCGAERDPAFKQCFKCSTFKIAG